MRNAESAKRTRKKRKENDAMLEKACEMNEKRIQDLEMNIGLLSKELNQPMPSSSKRASSKKRSESSASTSSKRGEGRPDWFGDAF